MSIFAAIKSIIEADPGISSVVGTRVTRQTLPRDPTFPAITMDGVSSPPWEANSSKTLPLEDLTIQLTCWASTATGSTSLARMVAEALHCYSGTSEGIVIGVILVMSSPDSRMDYNKKTGLYMTPLDVKIRY